MDGVRDGRRDSGGHGEAALLAYLRERRWFGEKGREVRGAEVVDAVPVVWPNSDDRFAVARVRLIVDGAPVHYQLFLRDGGASLDDALADEAFRRGLVNAFAGGASFGQGGTRWIVESEGEASLTVPADAAITLARAEQSNSSLFVGTQAVLKLFRKLAPGAHPDIEVTRFLTVERRFLHTPALLGTIHFADARGTWAAGMLQEFVPGATDAWNHALECSLDWFAGTVPDDSVPFTDEAERLGAITREMHGALASGDPGSPFERRAATADDLAAWVGAAGTTMRGALQSLERAPLDGEARSTAAAVVGRRDALEHWVSALARDIGPDAGARIRTHGDYHLGQVLLSVTNAFLVVDFEGEPARSLEERRTPQSPLRDVAGMLRSFAYAAAVMSEQGSEILGSRLAALGQQPAASRRERWEAAVRDAFLRGYFDGRGEPKAHGREPKAQSQEPKGILPSSRENAGRLIALFEAEKAFYELQYELDHRPDWAWIPLRAIEAIPA